MRKCMLIAALFATPAGAEVKSATVFGFEVQTRVVVAAGPGEAYAALTRPASWWNGAHSYSGDAANLTLDARAGGCFCEALPGGGSVEHMRVVYAEPGATLRLQGGLGPLQAEGAAGALTWTLKKVGGGTEITQTYVVGGYLRTGAEKLAPLVDQVLAEQLARLQAKLGPGR